MSEGQVFVLCACLWVAVPFVYITLGTIYEDLTAEGIAISLFWPIFLAPFVFIYGTAGVVICLTSPAWLLGLCARWLMRRKAADDG